MFHKKHCRHKLIIHNFMFAAKATDLKRHPGMGSSPNKAYN